MKLLLLFFLLLLPILCRAWYPRLENITITRGEPVEFNCPLPEHISRKDHIIQWKKIRSFEDHLVLAINGKIPQSLVHLYQTSFTNQDNSLKIFNVDRSDSTSYVCEIFESQTILCQYNLLVLVKPEASSLTISSDDLEEYQAVTMTCSSRHGNPPPQYTWFRNETLFISTNNQVTIGENGSMLTVNVTRSDHQTKYRCEIWNSALVQPIRLENELNVKYRPYVKILEQTTIQTSKENQLQPIVVSTEHEEEKLTCLFDANPPPTSIYWITNGTTIVSREKFMFIPRTTSEHSGVYSCVVENIIGKSNESFYLDVQYSPRVHVAQPQIIVNRTDSVVLHCDADANPLPNEIIWMKNSTIILQENGLVDLHLPRVERNDSGVYTCLIYNRFHTNRTGNGSKTIELIVQTRPIIETTHSKIATEIGQAVTLICRVSGQPMPIIYWMYHDKVIPCDEIKNGSCHLKFVDIQSKQFGSYRCIAENLLGREEWIYSIVLRGKPETPTDLLISDLTATSIRARFSPSFDGGSGSQQFQIEMIDINNVSLAKHDLSSDTLEFTFTNLNETSLYFVRVRAMNSYGESPWTHPIPVETQELIVTADDLPQLHSISYNSRETFLRFDYLPTHVDSKQMNEEKICLNIRQSTDGKIYQPANPCVPILHRRAQWTINEQNPFLRLSICSRKRRQICGSEIEMKEEFKNLSLTPMIVAIGVFLGFIILIMTITFVLMCHRSKQIQLKKHRHRNDPVDLDRDLKRMIDEPRAQNPYQLYTDTRRRSSLYDFSLADDHQRKQPTSFIQGGNPNDAEQSKDELDNHPSYRHLTRPLSFYRQNNPSRSGSHPSSESSCTTQIVYPSTETSSSPVTSPYGFPPLLSPWQLQSSSNKNVSPSDQISSSSSTSNSDRCKGYSYEVVV